MILRVAPFGQPTQTGKDPIKERLNCMTMETSWCMMETGQNFGQQTQKVGNQFTFTCTSTMTIASSHFKSCINFRVASSTYTELRPVSLQVFWQKRQAMRDRDVCLHLSACSSIYATICHKTSRPTGCNLV